MYKFTYTLLILFNITWSSIDKMIRISCSIIGKMFITAIKWFKNICYFSIHFKRMMSVEIATISALLGLYM